MSKYFHEQDFSAGLKQDTDPHRQPANSYRYARNGRLLYNRDQTDSSNGRSLSFCNTPGNALLMQLPLGTSIIHLAESRLGTIVFSVRDVDSEIGLWLFDEESNGIVTPGAYQTLYLDALDPHLKNKPFVLRAAGDHDQDRLDWISADRFDSEIIYESEHTERIYWTSRRGAVHTLNLRDAPTALTSLGYYPSYWSAHAFRDRPDVVFPLIKLLGRGKGTLPSGAYQVAVQYRGKNGTRSAFSPITRRVFVTSEPMESYNPDGSINTTLTTAYRSNHHNRTMGASGKVTGESLRWELKSVDVRWQEVVLAVLYYETEGSPASVTALKPVPIVGSSSVAQRVVIEITQLDGEELSISELSQRHEPVLKVGTLSASQNRLVEANLTRLKPIGINAEAVSFTPVLKSMRADSTKEPTFLAKDNPISHRKDNDPLTNTAPTPATFVQRRLFASFDEPYAVENDYLNDKGQVWEWLHGSYFRGETEEFAVVLLDRLGQPMFAYPLPAFTFPEQYAPGPNGEPDYYSLTKLDPVSGLYDLRIMGLSVSGVRIPVADLYDESGRLNVSGFSIVKRKRIPRLLHQGVVFPMCGTDDCKNDTGRDQKPFGLPLFNYFDSGYVRPNRHNLPLLTPCGTVSDNVWKQTMSYPYFFTYHSPDVLIEGDFVTPAAGDVLKHVGIVGQAYGQVSIPLLARTSAFRAMHDYTKSLNTATSFPRYRELVEDARPALGQTSRLSMALLLNLGFGTTYEKFDKDDLNLKFETAMHPAFREVVGETIYGDGLLQRNAVLIKSADWPATDIAESEDRPASFRLVNYMQATPERASESEPYYSIGHFQPITQDILLASKPAYNSSNVLDSYEFNNVEVWGGDAHVSLFDFTRIYPFWSDNCKKFDYSLSHILPIESKYNLALRPGRTFARSAVRPEETACNQTDRQFTNGIMHQQPEDWNYNRVLLVDTSVVTYAPQPRDYLPTIEEPTGFTWSPVKQAGQLLDNWRMKLAGDAGQGDGSMGAITKLAKSDSGLYAWHQHGVELLPLDPMEMRASDAGTIVSSSGATFHRGIPISRLYGTQHPDSVWQLNGQMGAWDARMGVLLRHSSGGLDLLSQSENINDLVEILTLPLSAASESSMLNWQCASGVNTENSEVLITLFKATGQAHTLVYSTTLSSFVSEIDAFPTVYGKRGRLLVSVDPTPAMRHKLWAFDRGNYGQFYGNYFPTLLRFIVNPNPAQNKTFDNGHINVNESGVAQITRIVHSTPNGGEAQHHVLTPPDDDRFRFHQNVLTYPAHEWDWDGVKERLRDHYQTVEIELTNDAQNTLVSLTSYRTVFRSA